MVKVIVFITDHESITVLRYVSVFITSDCVLYLDEEYWSQKGRGI